MLGLAVWSWVRYDWLVEHSFFGSFRERSPSEIRTRDPWTRQRRAVADDGMTRFRRLSVYPQFFGFLSIMLLVFGFQVSTERFGARTVVATTLNVAGLGLGLIAWWAIFFVRRRAATFPPRRNGNPGMRRASDNWEQIRLSLALFLFGALCIGLSTSGSWDDLIRQLPSP
jgi:hypothetical protein